MHEQEPSMYEVECAGRENVRQQVKTTHFDPIAREPFEEGGVEVDCKDGTGAADPGGEQAGRRPCAGADVQAAPTLAYSDRVELSDGARIVLGLQQRQPRPFELGEVPL